MVVLLVHNLFSRRTRHGYIGKICSMHQSHYTIASCIKLYKYGIIIGSGLSCLIHKYLSMRLLHRTNFINVTISENIIMYQQNTHNLCKSWKVHPRFYVTKKRLLCCILSANSYFTRKRRELFLKLVALLNMCYLCLNSNRVSNVKSTLWITVMRLKRTYTPSLTL